MPPDKHKLLAELAGRRKNIRFNELEKLMSLFDFTSRRATHGDLFKHNKYTWIIVNVSLHRESGQERKVLEKYVNKCLDAIDEVMSEEVDSNEK